MKKHLIILKLLLFPYIFFPQSVISDALSNKISKTTGNEFISIIISINDDFDIKQLKSEFINNNTPIKKRASIICNQMRKVAKETQGSILDIILKNEKKIAIKTLSLEAKSIKKLIDSIDSEFEKIIHLIHNNKGKLIIT